MRAWMAVVAMLFAVAPATAGFRIEGGKEDSFPAAAGVIAVLPATCPATFDCAWLDRQIEGELLRFKEGHFRSAQQAQAALQALGKQVYSAEDRQTLAERLDAQTVLEIHLRELVEIKEGRSSDPDDTMVGGRDGNHTVRGRLEIRAYAAASGQQLADGTAFGDADTGSAKRLVGPMLRQLLDRMFPRRGR